MLSNVAGDDEQKVCQLYRVHCRDVSRHVQHRVADKKIVVLRWIP